MTEHIIERENQNALYLLSAVVMVFMTLVVAIQPLFLRNVLGVSFEKAGFINANIHVVTELLDLVLILFLGYLSDRYGRVPIATMGFLAAAAGALLAPFSLQLGMLLGIGGLGFYYLMRILMSLGTGAVWPQISALAGDFTTYGNRPRIMANTAFMMALGATLVYAVLMQIPRHAGFITVMLLTAGVALIGAVVTRRCLVDVAPKLEEERVPWRQVRDLLVGEERLRLGFASAFFARSDMVFIGMFLMMWFIYFADIVGVGQEEAAARGGALIGYAGVVVLVSVSFWGRLIANFGRVQSLATGLALSGLGFASMGFVVNPFDWFIILPTTLIAVGQAGCLVAPQVLTIDLAPKDIRGSVLGAFNVVGGIGIIFFVQIGGFLFDEIGPHAPFVFIGVGNLLLVCYAAWVMRGEIGEHRLAERELNEA